MRGPNTAIGSSVLVSVTCFQVDRRLDLPGVYRAGLLLRRRWPELDGAVGVWLWSEPFAGRTGSVSVWRSAAALRGFVALPEHVRIMRRYRDRGRISSTTEAAAWTSPEQVWARAGHWLSDIGNAHDTRG